MICGVDEAGRGPVIGPLVIAGVCIVEDDITRLKEIGVKDSKMHTPQEREALYKQITNLAICYTIQIDAKELDAMMAKASLNLIEARHFALVIEKLHPDIAYIDSADVSCKNFELMVKKNLSTFPRLIVEHKADVRYPVVSAASIVAKVERDREIKELHKTFGNFGSGYASDERTQRFLESYFSENRSFPSCVRTKWKTAKRAANLKLEEFF